MIVLLRERKEGRKERRLGERERGREGGGTRGKRNRESIS